MENECEQGRCLPLYSVSRFEAADCTTEQLQRNFQRLGSLAHQNVDTVYECSFVDDNCQWIEVKEQLHRGGSLGQQYCQPCFNAKITMKGLAAGLAYLHSKKIVHMRLCPANLTFNGETPVITHVWSCIESESIVPAEAADYFPPEAEQGCFGYSSDVWSLGLIFLEIALRRPIRESLRRACGFKELQQLIQSVEDSELRELIARILRRLPQQRPSMEEVTSMITCNTPRDPERHETIVDKLYVLFDKCLSNQVTWKGFEVQLQKFSLQIFLQANAGNARAMLLLGWIELKGNQKINARHIFAKALQYGEVRAYYGFLIMETNIQQRIVLLQEWAKTGDVKVLYLLSQAEQRRGNHAKAKVVISSIKVEDPELKGKLFTAQYKANEYSLTELAESWQSTFKELAACQCPKTIVTMGRVAKRIGQIGLSIKYKICARRSNYYIKDMISRDYKENQDILSNNRWRRKWQRHLASANLRDLWGASHNQGTF